MNKLANSYVIKKDYFLHCFKKQLSGNFRHTLNYKKLRD